MSAPIVLSTDQVPARERAGYWADLVWRSFGRLRSDSWGDERFAGRIHRVDLGGVRLCRLEASRHRVTRSAGADGCGEPDFLKMVVQHRGRSLFEQNGRSAWLSPGQFAVYDTAASYSVTNPEAVEQHVLLLPREPLLQGRRALEPLLVRGLDGTAGVGRLACETIRIAHEEAERTGRILRPDVGETIVHLVRLALLETAGERLPDGGEAVVLPPVRAVLGSDLRFRGDPVALGVDDGAVEVPEHGLEGVGHASSLPRRRLEAWGTTRTSHP